MAHAMFWQRIAACCCKADTDDEACRVIEATVERALLPEDDTLEDKAIVDSLADSWGLTGDKSPSLLGGAEAENLGWMNFMIKAMWPHVSKAIVKRAQSEILERAASEIERHPQQLKLKELVVDFDPGDVPPTLVGLRAYNKMRHAEQDFEGMQVDVDIHWTAENFLMRPRMLATGPGGIAIRVEDVAVTGMEVYATASTIFAPLITEEPCFGASQVFFLDLPDLRLTLDGLNKWPFMKKVLIAVIQRMTATVLSDCFVLPHRVMVKWKHDISLEKLVEVKSPLPLGLLEVEVLEARNLRALDVNLTSKATSDPYVTVRIGDREMRTSTIRATTSPKWPDRKDYLPVYNLAQIMKVVVFDDDVVTDDDVIGNAAFETVFAFCENMGDMSPTDGVWFPLTYFQEDGTTASAGELKLRVRFLRQQPCASAQKFLIEDAAPSDCPRLLTVKLLGMEGHLAHYTENAICTVEYRPRAPRNDAVQDVAEDAKEDACARSKKTRSPSYATKISTSLKTGMKSVAKATDRARSLTGLGFGRKQEGMPNILRSGKARPWSPNLRNANGRTKSLHMSPELVRAVEQLLFREKWEVERIAHMFGISVEEVRAAAELRANFETVWHEALHFRQLPEDPLLGGEVDITVSMPFGFKNRGGQVVFNRESSKLESQDVAASGVCDSSGLVGQVRLDLSQKPIAPDTQCCRRFRARLRRPKVHRSEVGPVGDEALLGGDQCDASIGEIVPGLQLEFMIEFRAMMPADPHAFVENKLASRVNRELLAARSHSVRGVEVVTGSVKSGRGSLLRNSS